MKLTEKLNSGYRSVCQEVGAFLRAPSRAQVQITLLAVGVVLLSSGLTLEAVAQDATYNDQRVAEAVAVLFGYMEGAFGALVMVVSGIGAILAAAFGQYKAALGCLIVAVGAFILRSFMGTFFNVDSINDFMNEYGKQGSDAGNDF